MTDLTTEQRAEQFLILRGDSATLQAYLGGGTDGDVWKTSRETAIKVFKYERGNYNERDTYRRLADWGVLEKIDGFWIPKLIECDDSLQIIEMDLMQSPPYIIDFAKVRIDRPPDFPIDVQEGLDQQGRERFEHNCPRVQSLLRTLESY